MLDGTSVGLGEQRVDAASPITAIVPGPASEAAEPRREIWFKRRINLIAALRELWQFRELIATLAERDLRVRYKQAVLGVAWAVFMPVVTMIAFTVLFTKVTSIRFHTAAPYALFSYMGLLPWTYFSSALSAGGTSLVGNVGLLNKLYCPREVFPIAAMIDAAFDGLIATLVLIVLFPLLGFAPKIESFYVPLLLIPLLLFTAGVTVVVSAVVVFMRDLRLVLPIIIQLGLFATPVIWPASNLSSGQLIAYSAFNPVVAVIDGLRATVLYGHHPPWAALGAGTAGSLVYLLVGFFLFKRLETGIADVA